MQNIVNNDILNANCEMVVVPISTAATISDSFLKSIQNKRIDFKLKKESYKLGDIEIHNVNNQSIIKYIVFACCVNNYKSDYKTIRLIGEKLGTETTKLKGIKKVATPFLGTGAGGLNYFESESFLYKSFYKAADITIELIFCTPDQKIFKSFEKKFSDAIIGADIYPLRKAIIENKKK